MLFPRFCYSDDSVMKFGQGRQWAKCYVIFKALECRMSWREVLLLILSKRLTTVFRNNLVMLFWKHIWDWCNIFEQPSVVFKRGHSLHFSWFQDREICYLTTDDNRILFREGWSTVHSPWCTWMKACKSIWTIFQTGGSSIRWTTFVFVESE